MEPILGDYPITTKRNEDHEAVLRFQAQLDDPVIPSKSDATCPECPSVMPMIPATRTLNQCLSCGHVTSRSPVFEALAKPPVQMHRSYIGMRRKQGAA